MRAIKSSANIDTPVQATVSYCVAIIPAPPLKELVASASQAITRLFQNRNIIDNKIFPAHISLFLGGTDNECIIQLQKLLGETVRPLRASSSSATQLCKGSRGFIYVDCDSQQFVSIINAVTDACGTLHRQHPRYRPHILERWYKLSSHHQTLLRKYGTYKIGSLFRPHISVAQVSEDHTDEAYRIACETIDLPKPIHIEAVQLVDIGHANERWDVLYEWKT